jgi:hypothetical protein
MGGGGGEADWGASRGLLPAEHWSVHRGRVRANQRAPSAAGTRRASAILQAEKMQHILRRIFFAASFAAVPLFLPMLLAAASPLFPGALRVSPRPFPSPRFPFPFPSPSVRRHRGGGWRWQRAHRPAQPPSQGDFQ